MHRVSDTPSLVMVTSSIWKAGIIRHISASLATLCFSSSVLSGDEMHISSHLFFHLSLVSGIQILSYPLALKSASNCKTGVEIPAEAFEISERLRKVDIVAQGSHGELSSFDIAKKSVHEKEQMTVTRHVSRFSTNFR